MKKTMILAAFAALISLAFTSCQKEELNGAIKNDPSAAPASESPVFTATISAGSKTTLDAESRKVSWENTDEITVTDKDKKSAVYSIENIDATTGKATFKYKSGDVLGDGPYTATYGTAPATAQSYSETPGQLHMTAQSTTTSLTFTVQCGLMEINLTKTGESVKSIAVTGSPTGGSEATYTLTCTESQSIAEKKPFYIAVPAGSYNKIVITDSEDKVCTLTAASGITVQANHIKPLTFGADKLNFKSSLPAGALPGVFSVSATKKVHFSKGNLYADGDKALHFEANQYSSASSLDASHVSHFTWSSTVEAAVGNSNSGDYLFCDESHKKSVDGSEAIYYALSTAEWQYLFNYGSYTSEIRKNKFKWATVNGVGGYVIAPDDFAGTFKDAYTDDADLANAGNLVFLPAAGYRVGSSVLIVGDGGGFWSSTASDDDESYAYNVYFSSYDVYPAFEDDRSYGYSVRLITESK